MTMSLSNVRATVSLPVLAAVLLCLRCVAAVRPAQSPIRIDCGQTTTPGTVNGLAWQADAYFQGGSTSSITLPAQYGLTSVESTLRVFRGTDTACYLVPVVEGRYLVRVGFAYYNYDDQNSPPLFKIQVQGAVVEVIDMQSVQSHYSKGAYYSDYTTYAPGANISLCLIKVNGNPFMNTLEVLPVDTAAYEEDLFGDNDILSNYLRVNLGGPALGPEPDDPGYRTWSADQSYVVGNYTPIYTNHSILNTGSPPDYLPMRMFQTARMAQTPDNATGLRLTVVPVNNDNDWYVRFYFAELDPTVTKGSRIAEIVLGTGELYRPLGNEPSGFDILLNTTVYTALTVGIRFNYTQYAKNYGEDLEIGVRKAASSSLQPIINGLELFEVITVSGQNRTHVYHDNGLSDGALAGIVIGSLLFLAILVCLCFLCVRRKRNAARGAYGRGVYSDAMEMGRP